MRSTSETNYYSDFQIGLKPLPGADLRGVAEEQGADKPAGIKTITEETDSLFFFNFLIEIQFMY